MQTFEEDLKEATTYHGHTCAGQIIGVRMARRGLELLEIDNPREFRDLIVYVECDRCLTDAIGTVTGCKLGRRNLKCLDYGKSAATFVNIQTGEAIRLNTSGFFTPTDGSDLLEFFNALSDEEMFNVRHVKVNYQPEDLPGKPLKKMVCPVCNERVMDGREVVRGEVAMCKACADGAYYDVIEGA